MEEWKKYKLGDIIHLIGGGTPKTTIDSFWNGDIPWLSVKDFNNSEKYVYQTEKSISKLGLEKSTTRLLQKNDIIISARGTVGEIAMLPFPMAFNQSCYGIRGDLDIIDQDYLYYLMKFKLAEIKSKTHGSVFDTITRDTFGNINCSLPAFNIQQKISNILSSFDDKIALNKRINDNLFFTIILLLIKSVEVQLFMDYDKKSEETNKITMLKKEPQYTVWLLDLMNSKCFG